jgi:hypothetical protein
VAITRPWVNPWGERERRGRFLASAASMTNDSRRASHKTDRSRGHKKFQNSDKTSVNTGRFQLRTPPMWGRVWGYPKRGQNEAEKRLLSLKKSSSGLIKTHQFYLVFVGFPK